VGKYVAEVGKQVEKLNAPVSERKDSSLRIESLTNRLNVLTIVLVVLTMTQLGYSYGTSSAEAVSPHKSPCKRRVPP
jgi:hypothetical protein